MILHPVFLFCVNFQLMNRTQSSEDTVPRDFLVPPVCSSISCTECLKGCSASPGRDPTACSKTCTTDECKNGCIFLTSASVGPVSEEEESWSLTTPEIFCYRVENFQIRGVVLKWNLLNVPASDTGRVPAVFVLQMRTQKMASAYPDTWTTLGTVQQGLVPVDPLQSSDQHQFRVTVVSERGRNGEARTTTWTLGTKGAVSLYPPKNLRVVDSSAQPDLSVTSRLAWSPSKLPSCHYNIHLLPDKGEVPLSHFRLTKPYDLYNFDMTLLSFSTNYTVHMRATDSSGRMESPPAVIWFRTPSCLEGFNFNFNVCAPGPPSRLRVTRVQRSTDDELPSSVQITWAPPQYATSNNKVLEYQVRLQEDLPVSEMKPGARSRIVRSVDGESKLLNVTEIRNGVPYKVSVRAKSIGGLGEPAVVQYHFLDEQANLRHQWLWSIGSVLVLATLVIVSLCVARKWQHRVKKLSKQDEMVCTSPTRNSPPPPEFIELGRKAVSLLRKSSDPYEVPYESIHIQEVIGSGAFGVVHRAQTWIGKVREIVAMKTLKENPSMEDKADLLQEVELLKLVGDHRNIVSLRGYCTTGPVTALLVEYCPLGDLRTYLTKKRELLTERQWKKETVGSPNVDVGAPRSPSAFSADSGISEERGDLTDLPSLTHLLSFVRQVAQGMAHLSSKRIVHRDLAARNVLLLTENHVKITDFGLSRDTYEEGLYRKKTGGRLPVRWMALESLSHYTYSTMTDV